MSDQDQRPSDRAVLGIHTNTEPGSPLLDGHAWLTITRSGKTEAYGLWPADHPRFSQEAAPPTDVRRGIENGFEATASRYYALTPDQLKTFEAATREKVTWAYTNTCASWASDTAHRVTGERVSASELVGLTDTPRQMRESIDALEKQRRTTQDAPHQPTEAQDHGSSSRSLSTSDKRDPQVEQLLASAGDPERMRTAIEALQESARGQAFAMDASAHAAQLTHAEQAQGDLERARGEMSQQHA
ncbi:hypothetical protein LU699_12835 [Luteimonas fraxinea]|uniref:Uncharacterized protein n=1 Tax=Luteimonas fraxinea TaxID=2901869 RepID=A0ABS8UF21_9GAMM|nr:hypothetical protein [Luteimonas fraxinea]MCD9098100.1 hypothetical protein [Luteimonas fraxinea]MCD9125369.1 hypothetical protein [Luteimonas fraxinea]UHH09174.1 hypothetical protein LU699_12835 [Luteimonas fraxinea]